MPFGPKDTRVEAFFCYNCNSFKPLVNSNDLCARCQEWLTKGWTEEEVTKPDITPAQNTSLRIRP
jgi:hypothetical protein